MASVEDRIVRMEFDNAAFERKLNTTLTSLGQLDKALKFTGAQKGLTDVSAAAEKVHFGTISDGIENVSKKFLALSTVALTVLSNITTQAMQSGAQLIKSFAIKPVLDGFQEYETNMNSIQTILANTASKGTTLDQVSDALQKLNTYSDQTIYNFASMARNIGTFTAAGVDLDTSVSSIKGIANIAAMSGSNAEQASTAMYQLSQAIAAGSLKLMDWNSVVNAGMGGEAFKSALFETGKAMHTLTDVPMSQTFKEWEDGGNSFRESLQDGWITADVLTTTLSAFTGDMTEEMLLAKGFNEQQAAAILKTAAIAKAAATEVKTFTQLMGTVKEAVGTGWADSFKIIIGNFQEAKGLWTTVNNSISTFVGKTSDARNALLQGWKDMGGRSELITGLVEAFRSFMAVINPIKEAFRDIFPPITAQRLFEMTVAFREFMQSLKPTPETIDKIHRVFAGLFAALSIGWNILKEGFIFFNELRRSLLSLVSSEAGDFLANLGDKIVELRDALVKGGGIKAFFAGLGDIIAVPLNLLSKFKTALGQAFGFFNKDTAEAVGDSMGRLGDRFENVKAIFEKFAEFVEPLEDAFNKVKEIVVKVKDAVFEFFGNLGQELAKVMNKGNFDTALDAINTGLLAGITVLIAKFIKNGFNLNINSVFGVGGGLIEQIKGTFGELTNTLKAMQTNIKANALLKIAGAIAILTASVLVLSMIDSEALTKALAAMAVGFTELMGSFALFTKMASTPKSAATFTIMSTGLILLSTALLIMSAAVRSFSGMSWEELARGLGGITAALAILIGSAKLLEFVSTDMIAAGVGITAMAVALTILGGALKIFGSMKTKEIAKGLFAMGAVLAGIVGFMKLVPNELELVSLGVALVGVGIGITIMAGALKIFGTMNPREITKGLLALAGTLAIVAGAMNIMPSKKLIAMAAALVIVGFALNELAGALKIMGTMKGDEIENALLALGGSLTFIAIAMHAMEGALPGAAALLVVSFALGVLAAVLKIFGKMDFESIMEGLAKMAISLGIIAGVSVLLAKATPLILALGIAIAVLAGGFALFGLGVMLFGKGLESIAKSGAAAAEQLPAILEAIGKSMPALLTGLAEGLVEFVKVIGKAAPVFAKAIGKLVEALLIELEKLIPKAGPVIIAFIEEVFRIIRSYAEEYVATGLFIIMTLLNGVANNIGPIVEAVGKIITNFLAELDKQIPKITQGLVNVMTTAWTSAANALGQIAATLMIGTGVAFIEGFFQGLQQALGPVGEWLADIGNKVLGFVGDVFNTLVDAGRSLINGLKSGIDAVWGEVTSFFSGIRDAIFAPFRDAFTWLKDAGEQVVSGFWQGIKNIWGNIKNWIENHVEDLIHTITHPWEIFSPSHLMRRLGENIMEGWLIGLQDGFADVDNFISNIDAVDAVTTMGNNMSKALSTAVDQMNNMDDFNPVITPVLDLTQVAKDASLINGFMQPSTLAPAYNTARQIALDRKAAYVEANPDAQKAGSPNVMFEQNIYSPTQLSVSDIYKQTRNQITIAKEELSIP